MLAVSVPKCIGHCDCDIVDGSTVQFLYSVAGVSDGTACGNNTTITAAEFLPYHLVAGHH